MPGHTKGSAGFLVLEEKILIAGDALNESLWLFNYGSLSMKQYIILCSTPYIASIFEK